MALKIGGKTAFSNNLQVGPSVDHSTFVSDTNTYSVDVSNFLSGVSVQRLYINSENKITLVEFNRPYVTSTNDPDYQSVEKFAKMANNIIPIRMNLSSQANPAYTVEIISSNWGVISQNGNFSINLASDPQEQDASFDEAVGLNYHNSDWILNQPITVTSSGKNLRHEISDYQSTSGSYYLDGSVCNHFSLNMGTSGTQIVYLPKTSHLSADSTYYCVVDIFHPGTNSLTWQTDPPNQLISWKDFEVPTIEQNTRMRFIFTHNDQDGWYGALVGTF